MISKKKYSIILFRKGVEKLKKLHSTVNLQNWIYHFKGPTKNIDFNGFINDETFFFDDIKSKIMRFKDPEKIKWNFNRN